MLLFAFTYSSYNLDFEYFLIITFFCGFFIVEKYCSSSAWTNQWWIFFFLKKIKYQLRMMLEAFSAETSED